MPELPTDSNGHKLTPEQVFRDYAPRVFALARRMLGNEADAEDVTQDVLVQVVRKLHEFRGQSSIYTWLYRITVNAALALRAKRARVQEHETHEPLDHFRDDGHHGRPIHPWSVPADQLAMDKERTEMIEKAIAGLPETYRDVYVLADVEGLTNQEIGTLLGLNVGAVKSRLHRARMLMRDTLAPHFEEVSA